MLAGLHHRDRNGEDRRMCASDLMHVMHPLWLTELCPQKWLAEPKREERRLVGMKSAALFASRMSNERSADELHPRKMERVNGVAPSSQPWQSRILLLNHTRLKWCPQPESHQQPGV